MFKKIVALCLVVGLIFILVPFNVNASKAYPKKGIVKSEYAANIGIEDVYLNRSEATKLANKLAKGSTKRQDTVAFIASLLPGAGPYLGYAYMASGWRAKEDSKKIKSILKNKQTKGVHIYNTRPIGRAAATGGGLTQHKIYSWNGKSSSIKSGFTTTKSTKKYLHVTKKKVWN